MCCQVSTSKAVEKHGYTDTTFVGYQVLKEQSYKNIIFKVGFTELE